MNYKRELLFRTSPEPTVSLPAGLRSTGHYRIASGLSEQNPPRPFSQFFWCVAGTGTFAYDGTAMTAHPGDAFYYLPDEPHVIHAKTDWEYYWFTLDGTLATEIISAFRWPRKPVPAGTCPVELFERLQTEIKGIAPADQRKAASTAYSILSAVGSRPGDAGDDDMVERAKKHIEDNYGDAGINVSVLAQHLGVHRATLSRLFHERTGSTCIEYLNSYRMQRALALLRDTREPVGVIARRCGYGGANYFSKAVARATGYAPLGFRRL